MQRLSLQLKILENRLCDMTMVLHNVFVLSCRIACNVCLAIAMYSNDVGNRDVIIVITM